MSSEIIQIGEMRASSMTRVINCPGSSIICGGEISQTNEYAAEGTAAHTLLEFCLRFGMSPTEFVGDVLKVEGKFEFEIDDDMASHVQTFLDWVAENVPAEAELTFEEKLKGDGIGLPNVTGHLDFSAYVRSEQRLIVADFKYGVGIVVDAIGNDQLATYGTLKIPYAGGPVNRVTLVIIQPRSRGEAISTWETDSGELSSHLKTVSRTARVVEYLTDNPNEAANRLHPGDHCQFCPALLKCPAVGEPASELALLPMDANDYLLSLTDSELGFWFSRRKQIRKWLDELEKVIRRRHDEGDGIPGHKLVETISRSRLWAKEQSEIESALTDAGFVDSDLYSIPKFLGPAGVEKLTPPDGMKKKDVKKIIAELVHRPPTGVTLVPLTDKRAAKDFDAVEMFDDETSS